MSDGEPDLEDDADSGVADLDALLAEDLHSVRGDGSGAVLANAILQKHRAI